MFAAEDKLTQFIVAVLTAARDKAVEAITLDYNVTIKQANEIGKPDRDNYLLVATTIATEVSTSTTYSSNTKIQIIYELLQSYVDGKAKYEALEHDEWWKPEIAENLQQCIDLYKLTLIDLIDKAIKNTELLT